MGKKSKSKTTKAINHEPVVIHEIDEDIDQDEPELKEDIKEEGTSEIVVDELSGIKFDIKSQGRVAIKALQKYQKEQQKKTLFPEMEDSVFLVVKYKKPAMKTSSKRRRFIDLPHSDRNPDNTSLCLILPDLDRSKAAMTDPDVEKQANEWKELLREKYNVTAKEVTKIYTMRQIEREILTEADKYKLSNTYDIFMVDSSLRKVALWRLGGCFQKVSKMPLPINPNRPNVTEQIKMAYSRISMDVQPLINTVSLRFGNLNQPISHLAENLSEVINRAIEFCPGGVENIRACYIQTNRCEISLPIYVDFGSANKVNVEKSRKRKYKPLVDELNTLPENVKVSVRADGKVYAINENLTKKMKLTKREPKVEKSEAD